MFKRIVSSLSLSPSAASELAFYARRLKREKVTRTFSAIAAVLVVGLQFATIAAPPTPSNAASPNDIIYGGFVSKDDLLNHYDGSNELKVLYAKFGITRADMVASKVATIHSKDTTLLSIGREQHWANDSVITTSAGTYYGRVLHKWDSGADSAYQVLEGTRSADGGFFAIMFRCGNIVYRNIPAPKPSHTPTPTPKPTPTPTPTPTKTPTPTPVKSSVACVKLTGDVTAGQVPLIVKYTGTGTATGQTVASYIFDFGDSQSQTSSNNTTSHTYTKAGSFTARLLVKGSTGTVSAAIPACSFTVTPTAPPAEFTKSKSATNVTQNIDATTKPAQAGDTIRYTLVTKNIGGTATNYVVVEHINDILEYADVVDSGGALIQNGVMTWPSAGIAAGKSVANTFTVKVKNPIPDTPVGTSDKYSYDLRMDNIYGTQVQVKIQPPTPKQIELASTTLPQTGAGTSTMIVLVIAILTLFFYFRNRQLMKEIRILRADHQGGIV